MGLSGNISNISSLGNDASLGNKSATKSGLQRLMTCQATLCLLCLGYRFRIQNIFLFFKGVYNYSTPDTIN